MGSFLVVWILLTFQSPTEFEGPSKKSVHQLLRENWLSYFVNIMIINSGFIVATTFMSAQAAPILAALIGSIPNESFATLLVVMGTKEGSVSQASSYSGNLAVSFVYSTLPYTGFSFIFLLFASQVPALSWGVAIGLAFLISSILAGGVYYVILMRAGITGGKWTPSTEMASNEEEMPLVTSGSASHVASADYINRMLG